MAGRNPRARAMLRAYRRAQSYAPERRDEVWARIEGSLDAGAPVPPVETGPAASGPPWLALGVGALVVAAAAAVLVLGPWRSEPKAPRAPVQSPHAAPADTSRAVVGAPLPAEDSTPGTATPLEAASTDGPRPASADAVTPAESTGNKSSPRPRVAPTPSALDDAPDPAIDELHAELILVQKARRALRDQRPARALEVLDAHARAFPLGQMREDRLVLRIEALCAAGKGPQARAESRLFLRAFPASAHADRVRAACSAK